MYETLLLPHGVCRKLVHKEVNDNLSKLSSCFLTLQGQGLMSRTKPNARSELAAHMNTVISVHCTGPLLKSTTVHTRLTPAQHHFDLKQENIQQKFHKL